MGFQINSKCVLRAWIGVYFHDPGPGSSHDQNSSIVLWKFATNITRYCHELSCSQVILMSRVTQQRSYDHELSSVMSG